VNNQWRKFENSKGWRADMLMIAHCTEIRLIIALLWKRSKDCFNRDLTGTVSRLWTMTIGPRVELPGLLYWEARVGASLLLRSDIVCLCCQEEVEK
jgi:hypothetical protein